MWDGTVTLQDCAAVYVGRTDQNTAHAHVAVQLAVGVDGKVAVYTSDRCIRARAVVIRPLAEHRVGAGREVVFVYVEPQSPIGRGLITTLGEHAAMSLPDRGLLNEACGTDPLGLLDRLTRSLGVHRCPPLDVRLTRALEALERSDGAPGAVRAAAHATRVAPSRLRSLAREQLGTPLSRWLLWRKLERSGRALAKGASLAEAAASGGFADQAHFTRTMRRMFGVTPQVAAATLGHSEAFRSRRGAQAAS